MKVLRLSKFLAGLFGSLLVAGLAQAQQMTTLKILWVVKPWLNNYMTTQSTYERDAYSSTSRGALMYVPYAGVPGAVPLYRLLGNGDHMDSKFPNEGGYNNEGVTSYVWTSPTAVRGLGEMKRLVHPTTGDHAQVDRRAHV